MSRSTRGERRPRKERRPFVENTRVDGPYAVTLSVKKAPEIADVGTSERFETPNATTVDSFVCISHDQTTLL